MAARKSRPRPRAFYEAALDESEHARYAEALEVDGLDGEIALLRLRLQQAVRDNPEDVQLMAKGIELLVKATAAKYRLSKAAREDLSDSLAATVNSIGAQLFPEGFGNG